MLLIIICFIRHRLDYRDIIYDHNESFPRKNGNHSVYIICSYNKYNKDNVERKALLDTRFKTISSDMKTDA